MLSPVGAKYIEHRMTINSPEPLHNLSAIVQSLTDDIRQLSNNPIDPIEKSQFFNVLRIASVIKDLTDCVTLNNDPFVEKTKNAVLGIYFFLKYYTHKPTQEMSSVQSEEVEMASNDQYKDDGDIRTPNKDLTINPLLIDFTPLNANAVSAPGGGNSEAQACSAALPINELCARFVSTAEPIVHFNWATPATGSSTNEFGETPIRPGNLRSKIKSRPGSKYSNDDIMMAIGRLDKDAKSGRAELRKEIADSNTELRNSVQTEINDLQEEIKDLESRFQRKIDELIADRAGSPVRKKAQPNNVNLTYANVVTHARPGHGLPPSTVSTQHLGFNQANFVPLGGLSKPLTPPSKQRQSGPEIQRKRRNSSSDNIKGTGDELDITVDGEPVTRFAVRGVSRYANLKLLSDYLEKKGLTTKTCKRFRLMKTKGMSSLVFVEIDVKDAAKAVLADTWPAKLSARKWNGENPDFWEEPTK